MKSEGDWLYEDRDCNQKSEDELLFLEEIESVQQSCPMVSELKRYVVNDVPVSEWKDYMEEFKRFVDKFVI